MQRLFLLLILATTLSLSAVHAATLFNATGVFTDGAVLTGTITLDTTTGLGLSADVFLSAPDANEFLFIQSQFTPTPGVVILQLSPVAFGVPHLILAFPVSDFTGYSGGVMCSPTTCGGSSNLFTGYNTIGIVSGNLAPASTAPEPSAAWLLAGGGTILLAARGRRITRR